MKYKWNWGTKLALWITAFILFMLTLVFLTFQNDAMLVERDYYPKGLEYQNRIDEVKRAGAAGAFFDLRQENNTLILDMVNIHADSGKAVFFRPSDNTLDLSFDLATVNKDSLLLPITKFKKGKYILKSQWYKDGESYYFEKILFIK